MGDKAFRTYDAEKPVGEYRFRVEESYDESGADDPYITDEIWTDDPVEAERILAAMIDNGYPASRIVEQSADA